MINRSILSLLFILTICGSVLAADPTVISEEQKSFDEYKRQQAEYAKILEETKSQLGVTTSQQERYDRILETWERQQKEYQEYLDGLNDTQ